MQRGFGVVAILILAAAAFLLSAEAASAVKNQHPDSIGYSLERFGEDWSLSKKISPGDLKQKKIDEVKYFSGKDSEAAKKVARDALAIGANASEVGKSLGMENASKERVLEEVSGGSGLDGTREGMKKILSLTTPGKIKGNRFMLIAGTELDYSGRLRIRLERVDGGNVSRALFYTYGKDYGMAYIRVGKSLELRDASLSLDVIRDGAAFFSVSEKKEPLVALISGEYASRLGPEISQWIADLGGEGWSVTPVYLDAGRPIKELVENAKASLKQKGLLNSVKYAISVGNVPWAMRVRTPDEAKSNMQRTESVLRYYPGTIVMENEELMLAYEQYLYDSECVFSETLNQTAFCVIPKKIATGEIWPNTGDFENDIQKAGDYFRRLHEGRNRTNTAKRVLYYSTTVWDYNACGETDIQCIREKCSAYSETMAKKSGQLAGQGIAMDAVGCTGGEFSNRTELNSLMGREFLAKLEGDDYDVVIVNAHGAPSDFEGIEGLEIKSPRGRSYVFLSCSVGRFDTQKYSAGSFVFGGGGLVARASTVPIYVVSVRDIFMEIAEATSIAEDNYIGDFTVLAGNKVALSLDMLSKNEQVPIPAGMKGRMGLLPGDRMQLSGKSASCSVYEGSVRCNAREDAHDEKLKNTADATVAYLRKLFSGGGWLEASWEMQGVAARVAVGYSQPGLENIILERALAHIKKSVEGGDIWSSHPQTIADSNDSLYLKYFDFLKEYKDKAIFLKGNTAYLFVKNGSTLGCEGALRGDIRMIGALYETRGGRPVADLVLTNGALITLGIKEFLEPKGSCSPPETLPEVKCEKFDVDGDGGLGLDDLLLQLGGNGRDMNGDGGINDEDSKEMLKALAGAESCR